MTESDKMTPREEDIDEEAWNAGYDQGIRDMADFAASSNGRVINGRMVFGRMLYGSPEELIRWWLAAEVGREDEYLESTREK